MLRCPHTFTYQKGLPIFTGDIMKGRCRTIGKNNGIDLSGSAAIQAENCGSGERQNQAGMPLHRHFTCRCTDTSSVTKNQQALKITCYRSMEGTEDGFPC